MTAATKFDDDVEGARRPLVRGLWWFVSLLAAVLLLAIVAIASTAILSPDAFLDTCSRPQLVTPLGCGPEQPSAPVQDL